VERRLVAELGQQDLGVVVGNLWIGVGALDVSHSTAS
jgi:hypothetical protein